MDLNDKQKLVVRLTALCLVVIVLFPAWNFDKLTGYEQVATFSAGHHFITYNPNFNTFNDSIIKYYIDYGRLGLYLFVTCLVSFLVIISLNEKDVNSTQGNVVTKKNSNQIITEASEPENDTVNKPNTLILLTGWILLIIGTISFITSTLYLVNDAPYDTSAGFIIGLYAIPAISLILGVLMVKPKKAG